MWKFLFKLLLYEKKLCKLSRNQTMLYSLNALVQSKVNGRSIGIASRCLDSPHSIKILAIIFYNYLSLHASFDDKISSWFNLLTLLAIFPLAFHKFKHLTAKRFNKLFLKGLNYRLKSVKILHDLSILLQLIFQIVSQVSTIVNWLRWFKMALMS